MAFKNFIIFNILTETLLKTNPLNFAYVELNSIMQLNANILSNMYLIANDQKNSKFYKDLARRFQIGINAVSIYKYMSIKYHIDIPSIGIYFYVNLYVFHCLSKTVIME